MVNRPSVRPISLTEASGPHVPRGFIMSGDFIGRHVPHVSFSPCIGRDAISWYSVKRVVTVRFDSLRT